jgi:triosephosphate isomerase
MARTLMIAGNWKMHKTIAESVQLAQEIKLGAAGQTKAEVLVAPTYCALHPVAQVLEGSNILLAGQNLFWEEQGAFTGEISGCMLRAAGASHVLVGHSERRQYFHETDQTVNKRIKAAYQAGLTPILCIGETLAEREQDNTEKILETQLSQGLMDITPEHAERLILAYEPVWAIGTGKTASEEQANQAHAFIRTWLAAFFGKQTADEMRILYGGSVKPENAKGLLGQPEVDGALIGGASLKSENFLGIMRAI